MRADSGVARLLAGDPWRDVVSLHRRTRTARLRTALLGVILAGCGVTADDCNPERSLGLITSSICALGGGYEERSRRLTAEIEVMTYNEGGRNDAVHKLPTRMKHPNLVLKRGVTAVKDLQQWTLDSYMGPARKEVTLTMYNEALTKLRTWSFKNAYPVKWTGPQFSVDSPKVAMETLELAHHGFLKKHGVRHVLLTGYATDMCFCRTTAGYENLSKDFNVFLVGDATLATFPANSTPRFATNAHVSFASLNHLVTQVGWVRATAR